MLTTATIGETAWLQGWNRHTHEAPRGLYLAGQHSAGRLAELAPDPGTPGRARKAGAAAAIALLVGRRRTAMHDRWSAEVLAPVDLLADDVDPDDLTAVALDGGSRPTLKAGYAGLLIAALQASPDLTDLWAQIVADARADADAEGTGMASWAVAIGAPSLHDPVLLTMSTTTADADGLAGQVVIAAAGQPTGATALLGTGDWVPQQVDGLAGDLAQATLAVADEQLPVDELASLLDRTLRAGDGAEFYLDVATSTVYSDAVTDVLDLAGIAQLAWVTAGDGAVDGICLSNEALSPYAPNDVPFCPAHPRCRCFIFPAALV